MRSGTSLPPRLAAVIGAAGGRRALVLTRAADQGSIALASLLLAAALGVEDFAAVGAVLVVNSLALGIADFGLSLALLSAAPDAPIARRSMVVVGSFNGAMAVVASVVGIATGGDAGALVAACGWVWAMASVATTLRGGSLKLGAVGSVRTGDLVGAVVTLTAAALVSSGVSATVAWFAGGLVVRHAADALVNRGGWTALARGGAPFRPGAVVLSQLLAFGIANADYVVVGMTLGNEALAVYVLGFRMASAVPAQIAGIASRTSLVDLSASEGDVRQQRYERYARQLVSIGALGAIGTALAAPALPWLLGADWAPVVPVIVLLSIAVPYRLVTGVAGGMFLVGGRPVALVQVEVVRLMLLVLVLFAASRGDILTVAAAVAGFELVVTPVLHRLGGQVAGVRPWPALALGAPPMLLLVALLAVALG